MNFVRFPLNVLSGFPIAFCYGSPPRNFSRYPTALSQIFLKHSGFPAAFCQVSLQYFVKSSLGILSRHPGILAGFSPAFLAGFPQAFSQVSVTNCHYPLILLGEERERHCECKLTFRTCHLSNQSRLKMQTPQGFVRLLCSVRQFFTYILIRVCHHGDQHVHE